MEVQYHDYVFLFPLGQTIGITTGAASLAMIFAVIIGKLKLHYSPSVFYMKLLT